MDEKGKKEKSWPKTMRIASPRWPWRQSLRCCSCSASSCSPETARFTVCQRIKDLSQEGDHLGAVSTFLRFNRERSAKPDRPIYLSVLKAAASVPDAPSLVRSLLASVTKAGYAGDVAVATAALDALSKLSNVDDARKLFDRMPERDVAAWNAMLCGYSYNGSVGRAVSLCFELCSCTTKPNARTFSIMLQVCSQCEDCRLGRAVHAHVFRRLQSADTFLGNSLLVYYNKVGDVHIAERIFNTILERDIVTWNSMMAGYVQCRMGWRALELFSSSRGAGLQLDTVTLEMALQACAQLGENVACIGQGIFGILIRSGIPTDVYADNNILLMLCKCGMMVTGDSYFDGMRVRNEVSWKILIDGYLQSRCPERSLKLAGSMMFEMEVSCDVLVSALQAARMLGGCLRHVKCMHSLSLVMGFCTDAYVTSSLISAYGDAGHLEFATKCFNHSVSIRSDATVCWNSMLSVYVHSCCFSEALDLVKCLHVHARVADGATLVNILSVCTQLLNVKLGKVIHGYIIINRFVSDTVVMTALLELYVKCGFLVEACHLFMKIPIRNIVTWNTMLHGCLQNNFPGTTLKLFHLMQLRDGILPDATSLVSVVDAIANRGYKEERYYIHKHAIEKGLAENEFVSNSLLAMHLRFHDFDKGIIIFNRANTSSTVKWNILISGYSNSGLVNEAISTFFVMKINNVKPDSITLLCLLQACTVLGSLRCLTWVHAFICKCGFEYDIFVGTSLLDGYGKCGDLSMARQVFDRLNDKSIISWNSMIQGYGVHGNLEQVHKLFSRLQKVGLDPSTVTFLNAISACSHGGDVQMGKVYFDIMMHHCLFNPSKEHLSVLIDLLSRNGLVNDAYLTLQKLPMDPGLCAWGALFGACRVQGNLEIGLMAAEKLLELSPSHAGYCLLLPRMYAEAGKSVVASTSRNNFESLRLNKDPGWSFIESFS